jgi:nitroimidazol reductase NimA-like FMN-containing flavoprotein (pyridoxamine 5'-phosphate oxidase superfamily)
MELIKDEIEEYLSKRKFLTLGTSSKKGMPLTHPVAYVNIGHDVYFSTNKETRKVKNILENPNVAYSIYDQTDHLDEIRLLQMKGKASRIVDKKEHNNILEMLRSKFPYSKDIPVDSDTYVIKITPKSCLYSDYNRRFGKIEKIEF